MTTQRKYNRLYTLQSFILLEINDKVQPEVFAFGGNCRVRWTFMANLSGLQPRRLSSLVGQEQTASPAHITRTRL